jgi:hypothetical protein
MKAAHVPSPLGSGWPCGLCGGTVRGGAIWRAQEDSGEELCEVPAEECIRCGCVRPDVHEIDEMDTDKVPSSVRIRCDEIRFANWRIASQR